MGIEYKDSEGTKITFLLLELEDVSGTSVLLSSPLGTLRSPVQRLRGKQLVVVQVVAEAVVSWFPLSLLTPPITWTVNSVHPTFWEAAHNIFYQPRERKKIRHLHSQSLSDFAGEIKIQSLS